MSRPSDAADRSPRHASDPFDVPLDGLQLIEASAGTGKTWTIASLFVRMIAEGVVEIDRILVVTYTVAATAELRDRIRRRLAAARAIFHGASTEDVFLRRFAELDPASRDEVSARVEDALRRFDQAAISTIHGFCARVLSDLAFETGTALSPEVLTDEADLVQQVVDDYWRRGLDGRDADLVRSILDRCRSPDRIARRLQFVLRRRDVPVLAEGLDDDDPRAFEAELVRWGREALRARKRDAGRVGYDDLLQDVHDALGGDGDGPLASAIRRRFPAALVDEFQDTDALQYGIFRTLYAGRDRPVFLVGDPKQAIYGFRGADVFTYLDAARDAECVRTLSTNWRSDGPLLRALDAFFRRNERAFVLPGIEFSTVRPAERAGARLVIDDDEPEPFRIWWVPRDHPDMASSKRGSRMSKDTAPLATVTARDIARRLAASRAGRARIEEPDGGARPLRGGDIAVLVRTNAQGAIVRDALAELRIPSVQFADENVFLSDEAGELERVLRAVASPGDDRLVRAALVTEMFGIDARELEELADDEDDWERALEDFRRYRDLWRDHGPVRMLRTLMADRGVPERVLRYADGERRLTNLLHVSELTQEAWDGTEDGFERALRWISNRRRTPRVEQEAQQLRLESDRDIVKIVTIHMAKGLEYPVTYVPFAWWHRRADPSEPLFYRDERRGTAVLDLVADDDARARARREQLAEDVRILYVALTRARHRCTIAWGSFNEAENSALAWVLHGRPEETPAAFAARHKSSDDSELVGELARLADAAEGAIVVRPAPSVTSRDRDPSAEPESAPGDADLRGLEARTFDGTVAVGRELTSFSALRSVARPVLHDYDGASVQPPLRPAPGAPRTIHTFPAGARAGRAVHAALERIDFTRADGDAARDAAAEALAEHDLDTGWTEVLVDALRRTVGGWIDPERDVRLEDVPWTHRVSELEFTVPVRDLEPRAVEEAVGSDDAHEAPSLRFDRVSGYLRGFIDLVFEAHGRYWVVDFKSNRLAADAAGYDARSLAGVMAREGYRLQAALYAAATHRYLASRVAGYDYDLHFGGVAYLFVRGMRSGTGDGVYFERPSRERIESLDALFTPGTTS